MSMTTSFHVKAAQALGDTFTDAVATDVLLCLNNGPANRAILAGFTNPGLGVAAGASKLRLTSSAMTVATSLGIGTITPQSALDVVGTVNVSSNLGVVGSLAVGSNLTVAGGLTVLGPIVSAGQSVGGGGGGLGSNSGSNVLINGSLTVMGTVVAGSFFMDPSINGSNPFAYAASTSNASLSTLHLTSNVTFGSNNASLGAGSGSNLVLSGGDLQIAGSLSARGYLSNAGNVYGVGASNVGGATYTAVLSNAGAMSVGGALSAGSLTVAGTSVVGGGGLGMFRNKVINGDMRIDQRMSGAKQANAPGGAYIADRFITAISTGAVNVQQMPVSSSTGSYAGLAAVGGSSCMNCIMIQVATAVTNPNNGDWMGVQHHFEGLRLYDLALGTPSAQPITLSFFVCCNSLGTFSASLRGAGNCIVAPFSIAAVNTWQRVVLSLPGCTIGTWSLTTSSGLNLDISILAGSNICTSSTSTWFGGGAIGVTGMSNLMGAGVNAAIWLTGVQLEIGTQASPFEFRPFATELQLCQRYFVQLRNAATPSTSYSTYGTAFSVVPATGNMRGIIILPTAMRDTPSLMLTEGTTSLGGTGVTLSGNRNSDSLYVYMANVDYSLTLVSIVDMPTPYGNPTLVKLVFDRCSNNNGGSGFPAAGSAGEMNSAPGVKNVAFSAEI